MTWWVNEIDQYIRRLNDEQLKQLLLHHFNRHAIHLSQLFCKHHPQEAFVFFGATEAPSERFLFSLIYTYGPQQLAQELATLLHVESPHELFVFKAERVLDDFVQAWPLITALQHQPKQIISLLEHAPQKALSALKKQVDGNPLWSMFIDLFLAPQLLSEEEQINLMSYFRGSHWIHECERIMTALKREASTLLSIHVLNLIASFNGNESFQWQQLLDIYTSFPFTIDEQILARLVVLYSDSANESFIILFEQALKSMSLEQRVSFCLFVPINKMLMLVESCVKNTLQQQSSLSDASLVVINLLCSVMPRAYDNPVLQLVRTSLYSASAVVADFCDTVRIEDFFSQYTLMAHLTKMQLKELLLRYQCLMLTLNEEEFNALLGSRLSMELYVAPTLRILREIEQQLLTSELWDKKQRIRQWCIERMQHQLLSELTDVCHQNSSDKRAHDALHLIYEYYFEQSAVLRFDLMFNASIHFYERSCKDLAVESMITHKLQKQAFQVRGVIYLYDSADNVIALVDEFNRIWQLNGAEPCLISKKACSYFDKQGNKVLHVGYFMQGLPHYKIWYNELLCSIPWHQLHTFNEQAFAPVLYLLVAYLLTQGRLDELYQALAPLKIKNSATYTRLQIILMKVLTQVKEPLSEIIFAQLNKYLDVNNLFYLLGSLPRKDNFLLHLDAMLLSESVRPQLFTQTALLANNFLARMPHEVLAYYLTNYHQYSWWGEGLRFWSNSMSCGIHPSLFHDALTLLQEQVNKGLLCAAKLNDIKYSVLASDETITLLLNNFGGDEQQHTVQEMAHAKIVKISEHFDTNHMIFLLQKVVNNSALYAMHYRLLLFILYYQQNLIPEHQWTTAELQMCSVFIKRHQAQNHKWDKGQQIGFDLVGVLLRYCATKGETSLFFNEQHQLSSLARFWVHKKLMLPLMRHFDGMELLPEARRLLLNNQSHDDVPLLGVYVLYYVGKSHILADLLHYYLDDKRHVSFFGQFLTLLPKHGVSAVIFDAMQKKLINDGSLLDWSLLQNMASYLWHKTNNKMLGQVSQAGVESIFSLLTTWGQAKHYKLVASAAQLFSSYTRDPNAQKKIAQVITEAQTEERIKSYAFDNSLFAMLNKWWWRTWCYGFFWPNNLSQILSLCDVPTHACAATFSPLCITRSSQGVSPSIKTAKDNFRVLITQIVRSSLNNLTERAKPSGIYSSLFATTAHTTKAEQGTMRHKVDIELLN